MGFPAGIFRGGSARLQTGAEQNIALVQTRLGHVALAAGLILAAVFPQMLSATVVRIAVSVLVAVIASIATTLLVGIAGQLSLAGAAFMAVGAFTAFFLQDSLDAPFVAVFASAPLTGALLGGFLALPALRLRGLYLVLATLGFHYIVSYIIKEYEASRGTAALAGLILNPPNIKSINWGSGTTWYYLMLALSIGVTLFALNIKRSRFGRAWVALRDRDIVATSLGIAVGVQKILAFSVSSAILAVAGVMSSLTVGVVSSEYFSIDLAIQVLVMAVIGGLGSIFGAWLGAIFVVLLPHLIQGTFVLMNAAPSIQLALIVPIQLMLFGAITIAFLLFEPAGLAGLWVRVKRYFQYWPRKQV